MTHEQAAGLLAILPTGIIIQLLVCTSIGLYAGRWSAGSLEEAGALARRWDRHRHPHRAQRHGPGPPDPGGCVHRRRADRARGHGQQARYAVRLRRERKMRPDTERASRVIVFGAGEGGDQTITAMMRNPDSRWFPVALLDDDPGAAAPHASRACASPADGSSSARWPQQAKADGRGDRHPQRRRHADPRALDDRRGGAG